MKVLRDLAATVAVLVVIGVISTLVPVLTAILAGIGTLIIIGLMGAVIYSGFKGDFINPKDTE